MLYGCCFFFSSRRRHTRLVSDWSSDVCSSDLSTPVGVEPEGVGVTRDGTKLYVTAETNNTVSVLDARTGRLLKTLRSEERRVGKECRSRGSPTHTKKKKERKTCTTRITEKTKR